MSLFILGSCSRITRNIILALAKSGQYSQVTLGDTLPLYTYHNRYYALRRELDEHKLQLNISLKKLSSVADITEGIAAHRDLLYVTHDYYMNTTPKTKILKITAQAAAKKKQGRAVFALPLEYNHYGFSQPTAEFVQSCKIARASCPKAVFVTSDVQDSAETISYLHTTKNVWEEFLMTFSRVNHFAPKVVSSSEYTQEILSQLSKGSSEGQLIQMQGKQAVSWKSVQPNLTLDKTDLGHVGANVRSLIEKYTDRPLEFSTV